MRSWEDGDRGDGSGEGGVVKCGVWVLMQSGEELGWRCVAALVVGWSEVVWDGRIGGERGVGFGGGNEVIDAVVRGSFYDSRDVRGRTHKSVIKAIWRFVVRRWCVAGGLCREWVWQGGWITGRRAAVVGCGLVQGMECGSWVYIPA